MKDFFRPRTEPAITIYDAFHKEAKNRDGKEFSQWNNNEIVAVFTAAVEYAQKHRLRIPTLDEVRETEQYASGSADYGSKWAYAVVRIMEG